MPANDKQKISLPQHMQLDMVSPATRLLEKRRVMYEVQKAFEDQKEDFKKEEERCRIREQELREKDTLIQDNLIRFSTFLQQQEQRRKKDENAAIEEKAVRLWVYRVETAGETARDRAAEGPAQRPGSFEQTNFRQEH